MRGLFLERQDLALFAERSDAETFRIGHDGTENGGALRLRGRLAEHGGEPGTVEDVVAEDQHAGIAGDEIFRLDKRVDQTLGLVLNRVMHPNAETGTVAEQTLETALVHCGRDKHDVAHPRLDQNPDRVIDHRFVINGDKLFIHG